MYLSAETIKKLKTKIDSMETRKKIYSYGYINNVDVFMDACDCIITKPGGLTTSEALAKTDTNAY